MYNAVLRNKLRCIHYLDLVVKGTISKLANNFTGGIVSLRKIVIDI